MSAIERPEPDLLTIPEVAARIGVPYATVHNWVNRDLIAVALRDPRRRGYRWLRWADVKAFGEVYYRSRPRPAWLDEE